MIPSWANFIFLILTTTLMRTLGAPIGEGFDSPSGRGEVGLRGLSSEQSGLTAASNYRDPRAWTERLEPASIGTVGTGIGVGDFNRDGWPDLFVAIREGKNRLYINTQKGRFIDRTEKAGILESEDWTTGVTVVDINGDHLPDIYVCFFDSPNHLYINRGGLAFEEIAQDLGLDIRDSCSGAFFADYDKDGDLDLYLQTNYKDRGSGQPDYFFRNEGDAGFEDVTTTVGIFHGTEAGTFGHSVLWFDYNKDGWEDIYVANDFRAPDFLYLNTGDGNFWPAQELIPIAPYSSMGSDLGDVNGDGRLDILTTDMATPSYLKHVQSMLTSGTKTRDLPEDSWPRQVMKNCLLLNRGYNDYVDVAYAWNLAATDWTWASRLVDLDNDGWQDALFTNGMIRQFHNADLALAQDRQATVEAKTAVLQRSPVLNERNLVFRNVGGNGFEEANADWGFEHEGVSFATALLDYDRDGDLDFIYTNYQAPPTLWRNDLGTGNSVQLRLVGKEGNTEAIGAIAIAHIGQQTLAQKILSNRGYLGTDEKVFHFGLGEERIIKRLEITWPDGSKQTIRDLEAGKRYKIEQADEIKPVDVVKDSARFIWNGEEQPRDEFVSSGRVGEGLLYPFKPLPGLPKERLLRLDFNRDGSPDTLIIRDWGAPRLLVSGETLSDASEDWGLAGLKGLWDTVLVEDFTGDSYPDLFLGGMGLNNEISFRGVGEGKMIRHLGRFSSSSPWVNLNAYDWNGELRLFDGLRDFTEIVSAIFGKFNSFKQSASLTPGAFIERVNFQVEESFEIDHFKSGLLVNQGGGGFHFEPLPLEGQYGRVWDAVSAEVNNDGIRDLVLLLGQVSPHYRSSQNEGSFVTLLLGQGDGTFEADQRSVFDKPPDGRVVGLALRKGEGEVILELQMEDGRRVSFGKHGG